jgi:WD40 repeat protein
MQNRGDREQDLVVWEFGKKGVVQRFPLADIACHRVAVSKDGKLVATGGYYKGIVQVFDLTTNKEIARFRPHDSSASVTFSDDGASLLTASEDATVLIWDFRHPALQSK